MAEEVSYVIFVFAIQILAFLSGSVHSAPFMSMSIVYHLINSVYRWFIVFVSALFNQFIVSNVVQSSTDRYHLVGCPWIFFLMSDKIRIEFL